MPRLILSVVLCLVLGAPAAAGTIAHYRFDEQAPGTPVGGPGSIVDDTGQHDATPVSLSHYVAGQSGSALEFTAGGSGRVEIADHPDFHLTGDYTIEAVLQRPTSLASFNNIIFSQGNATGDRHYFSIFQNQLRYSIETGAGTFTLTDGTSALDQWAHVAVVRQGNAIGLYYNGVQVGSGTASFLVGDYTNPASIGSDRTYPGGLTDFGGWIDEVRISDHARGPGDFLGSGPAVPEPGSAALLLLLSALALGGRGARLAR